MPDQQTRAPGPYYPIDPDAPIFGCNRLGHSWDEHGDCRYCPANEEDLSEGAHQ